MALPKDIKSMLSELNKLSKEEDELIKQHMQEETNLKQERAHVQALESEYRYGYYLRTC